MNDYHGFKSPYFPLESVLWNWEARCHPDTIDRLPLSCFIQFLELRITLVADPWIEDGKLFVIDKVKMARYNNIFDEKLPLFASEPVSPDSESPKISYNPFRYIQRTF